MDDWRNDWINGCMYNYMDEWIWMNLWIRGWYVSVHEWMDGYCIGFGDLVLGSRPPLGSKQTQQRGKCLRMLRMSSSSSSSQRNVQYRWPREGGWGGGGGGGGGPW
jgi:hypothetical protein